MVHELQDACIGSWNLDRCAPMLALAGRCCSWRELSLCFVWDIVSAQILQIGVADAVGIDPVRFSAQSLADPVVLPVVRL